MDRRQMMFSISALALGAAGIVFVASTELDITTIPAQIAGLLDADSLLLVDDILVTNSTMPINVTMPANTTNNIQYRAGSTDTGVATVSHGTGMITITPVVVGSTTVTVTTSDGTGESTRIFGVIVTDSPTIGYQVYTYGPYCTMSRLVDAGITYLSMNLHGKPTLQVGPSIEYFGDNTSSSLDTTTQRLDADVPVSSATYIKSMLLDRFEVYAVDTVAGNSTMRTLAPGAGYERGDRCYPGSGIVSNDIVAATKAQYEANQDGVSIQTVLDSREVNVRVYVHRDHHDDVAAFLKEHGVTIDYGLRGSLEAPYGGFYVKIPTSFIDVIVEQTPATIRASMTFIPLDEVGA